MSDEVTERLARDLAADLGRPVRSVRPIPEGHSGFTYWVELEGERAVLRVPPPGTRTAGPADIPRQDRLLRALHAAGVAVPRILASSDRPVLDGRPYYLMERAAGERVEVAAGTDDEALAQSAIEELHRLQTVAPAASGIGDESPITLRGEVERWFWLLERSPQELIGRAAEVRERLLADAPPERAPVLVHGDYHYGNMLFRERRVVALLDWEIAELGQPLLDLACMVVVGRAHQGPAPGVPGAGALQVEEADLLRWFGTDQRNFRWPLGFTYYKYAAIFGYNLMLHRRGKRPDETYESRAETIVAFLEAAESVLRKGEPT